MTIIHHPSMNKLYIVKMHTIVELLFFGMIFYFTGSNQSNVYIIYLFIYSGK